MHDPMNLASPKPTICIRTANRPQMLRRLLESIAKYEPDLLSHPIEVNDGSHSPELTQATRDVCAEFGFDEHRSVTHVNAMTLAHANFSRSLFQCGPGQLKAGYNMWQIMQRHQGQEIILLDDDWVWPLVGRHIGKLSNFDSGDWAADAYVLGDGVPMVTDGDASLSGLIQYAKTHRCNTLQLCTYGHGICNDYSWLPTMQRMGKVIGGPATATTIHYILERSRILSRGFFTPAWIGKVPHVNPIPPSSADDDTIMLAHNDFGPCLWSNVAIGHLRNEPKDFTKRIVTDFEVLHLVSGLFHEHDEVRELNVHHCADLLEEGKRAPFKGSVPELTNYINLILKAESPPIFKYEENV